MTADDPITVVKDAITDFLTCLEQPFSSNEERLLHTQRALDRLSLAYFESGRFGDGPGDCEPPGHDYASTRDEVALLYPDLGYYPVAKGDVDDSELVIGDAIDDLTDIYNEVRDVVWCLKNSTDEDAVRFYRFGYSHHWGRHICDVRSAIHRTLFDM